MRINISKLHIYQNKKQGALSLLFGSLHIQESPIQLLKIPHSLRYNTFVMKTLYGSSM